MGISSPRMDDEQQLDWMKLVKAELEVCVHPAWANNVQQGVREILNSILFRLNEDLDGVVLAYLDVKIPSCMAKILPGLSPYFKVNFTAKLLLFSPKLGMMLEGKVNKIEEDYIGILVLGLFNAAIGVTDIRDDFRFSAEDPLERAWVNDSREQHVIKLGTIIRFFVKNVQEKEDFLDIAGSLEPINTGCVDWLEGAKSRKTNEAKLCVKNKELNAVVDVVHAMRPENGYRANDQRTKKRKVLNA